MLTCRIFYWMVMPLLLAALIGCDGGGSSSGKNKTDDPPDMEEILVMRPLDHGLEWSPGLNGPNLEPPRVKKIDVPPIKTTEVTPLGVAWEIEMDAEDLKYPVHVSFPLPDAAKGDYDKVVFVKISDKDGKEEILVPDSVDKNTGRATLLAQSFSQFVPSKWIEAEWSGAAALVKIEGEFLLRDGCEETPSLIYLHLRSKDKSSEPFFSYMSQWSIGPYQIGGIFPESLWGAYILEVYEIHGFKFTFMPEPVGYDLQIDGPFSTHFYNFHVLPTESWMEGKITDPDGAPLAGMQITVIPSLSEDYYEETKSNSDGTYMIRVLHDDCPLKTGNCLPHEFFPPYKDAYVFIRTDFLNSYLCDELEEQVTLTAGQTLKKDFIFVHGGVVQGQVRDQGKNLLDGARIVLEPSYGRNLETVTRDGFYQFTEVPTGPAKITAYCPDKEDRRQSRKIKVTCPEELEFEPKWEPVDFDLNCEDTDFYVLQYTAKYIGHPDSSIVLATKVEAETSFSFTIDPKRADDPVVVPATMSARYSYGPAECWEWTPSDYDIAPLMEWTIIRTIEDGKEKFRFESVEMIAPDPVSVNCQNFCQTEVLDCGHEADGGSLSYYLYLPNAETWSLGTDYFFTMSFDLAHEYSESPGNPKTLTYYHAVPVPFLPGKGHPQYREVQIVLEKIE